MVHHTPTKKVSGWSCMNECMWMYSQTTHHYMFTHMILSTNIHCTNLTYIFHGNACFYYIPAPIIRLLITNWVTHPVFCNNIFFFFFFVQLLLFFWLSFFFGCSETLYLKPSQVLNRTILLMSKHLLHTKKKIKILFF